MAREIHVGDVVLFDHFTWEVVSRKRSRSTKIGAYLGLNRRDIGGDVIGRVARETECELVGTQKDLFADGAS